MSLALRERGWAGVALALLLAAQAAFLAVNVARPGWRLFDLDDEHNVPAYFHAVLLGGAALLGLAAVIAERRLLARSGAPRGLATLLGLGMAGLFAALALDESLVLHEELNRPGVRAWLVATSPLRATVTWLVVLAPAVAAGGATIVAWLTSRGRVSRHVARWAGVGLALWLTALALEGTAKAFFIPRNLYRLEVLLEETAESLGTTAFLWALWRYRVDLRARLAAPRPALTLAVTWGRVALVAALAFVAPTAAVGTAIVLNPEARLKSAADAHLRAGRLEEAAAGYRAAVARAPRYAAAWARLGAAELRRGDLDAAGRALGNALVLDPSDAAAAGRLGVVLLRQGQDAGAAEALGRAAALDPMDDYAYRNLAVALRRLGRDAEAHAALRRAHELRPTPAEVLALRVDLPADLPVVYLGEPGLATALAHTRAGRVEGAAAAYQAALAARPKSAAAHLALANELLRWSGGRRLAQRYASVQLQAGKRTSGRPAVILSYRLAGAGGGWEHGESRIAAEALERAPADAGRQAAVHYRRALDLGAAAPAHLGLALLAREEGRPMDARVHAAALQSTDPKLAELLRPSS